MDSSIVVPTSLPDYTLWGKVKGRRVPLSFEIEATARCNNDCRHCYINLPAGDRQAAAGELSLAEIGEIADQAVSLGALWCLLTGGEPLLRSDFLDLYLALKRRGLLVSVFTNACLVTREHAEAFRRYPPRDIEVTVYGATEETYERVTRRPGSYAAFTRGLDLLLGSAVKVRLKAMALRSNAHELPEIARFCRSRTKDYFRFDPLLHLRFDGSAQRNAEIAAERLAPEEVVAIERGDEERFGSLQRGCDTLITPGRQRASSDHLFHCGAGNCSFTVGHNGLFRLCSSLCHPACVYDLRKGSLAEAWQHLVPAVRQIRSGSQEFLRTCRVCPIVNLCLWCPAHAHLETGQMDARPGYFCRVGHARAAALRYQGAAASTVP